MSLIPHNVPINVPYRESSPGVPMKTAQESGLFGKDGLSFKDVLDSVNPLQQLPGVGMLYRAETGDSISPLAKIAGGALFGGPIGAALGAVDALVEMATGASASDQLASAVTAAPAAPAVPQEIAQALADDALAKETAEQAAVAKAKSDAAAQEAELATLGRGAPQEISAEEAAARAKDGIALAPSNTQFVYARQEQVYANNQAMEGLYKTASEKLKA